jgi:hypothetical protein
MHNDETIIPTEDRARFVQHLERASDTVRSWPLWKQTILGGIQWSQSTESTIRANRDGVDGLGNEKSRES